MWQIKRENATNGEHTRTLGKRVTVSTMSPSPSEVNKISLMGQQTRLRELSKPTGFNSKSEVKLETFFPGKLVETCRVATETTKSNSRTFLGHFPGLFQDCLKFFYRTSNLILTITLSCTYFFKLVIDEKF